MKSKLFGTALAFLVATAATYAREDIRVYTVPKEHPAIAQAPPAGHQHVHGNLSIAVASIPRNGQTWFFKIKGDQQAVAAAKPAFQEFLKSIEFTDASDAPLKFKTPAGWEEQPAGNMVIASFSIPGADGKKVDVSVTSFPGDVGGELANVNRWRQQVGLSAISEAPKSEPIKVGGVEGKFYEFGAEPAADTHAGLTAASSDSSDPHAGLNIPPANGGADPHAGLANATPEATSEGPKMDVPPSWKEKAPGPMVLKSYTVAGSKGAEATVAISSFPGDVGGKLGNVNRWRGQFGQPPIDESQLDKAAQTFETQGGTGYLVDIEGTDRTGKPARLVAVAIPNGGNTWFYKLSGDKSTVEESKDTFLKFVKSVRY